MTYEDDEVYKSIKCACGCGEIIPLDRCKNVIARGRKSKWFSDRCYKLDRDRRTRKKNAINFDYRKYTFDQIIDALCMPRKVKTK
jgi:hypothetical protein